MSARLIHLSVSAHTQALMRRTQVPAESYEFMHLPMVLVGGIPAFDSSRMRPDQVEDTIRRLEQITGRVYATGVRESVTMYMEAFGRFGLRVKDVCDQVGADKKVVLKYLRELVDAGTVLVKEEVTRGNGSKRKRYYWLLNEKQHGDKGDALVAAGDGRPTVDGPGVMYHGTEVCGLRCPCGYCQSALANAFAGEAVSAARRRGETGLAEGLELRRVRREAAQQEFEAALAAGLAARHG